MVTVLFLSLIIVLCKKQDCAAWKERGVGVIKILRHPKTNQARVLMRRDHVHKICTNHLITPQMELKVKQGSKNTLVYTTWADFADEVCKVEQLAVKFKSSDEAERFKKAFVDCQSVQPVEHTSPFQQKSSFTNSVKSQQDVFAKYAPKTGSWTCAVCYLNNDPKTRVCIACGASRIDVLPSLVTSTAAANFEMPQPAESRTSSLTSTATVFSTPPPVSRATKMLQFGETAPSFTFRVDSQDFNDAKPHLKEASVFCGKGNTKLEQQPLTFGAFVESPPQSDSLKAEVTEVGTQTPPHKCEKCNSGAEKGSFFVPKTEESAVVNPFALQKNVASAASPFTFTQVAATQNFWQRPQLQPSGFAPTPAELGFTAHKAQQNVWYPAAFALRELAQQGALTQPTSAIATSLTTSQAEQPFVLNPQSMKSSPFVPGQGQTSGYAPISTWFSQSAPSNQFFTAKSVDFRPYVVEEPFAYNLTGTAPQQLSASSQHSTVTVEECLSDEFIDQEGNSVLSECETGSEVDSNGTPSTGGSGNVPLSEPQPERPERPSPGIVATRSVPPQELIQPKEKVPQQDVTVLQQSPVTGRRIIKARVPQRQDFCAIIYEAKPNRADREKASKLLLPPNFYNFKRFPACSGCRGCSDKNEIAANVAQDNQTLRASSPKKSTEDLPSAVFGRTFGGQKLTFTDFAKQATGSTFVKKGDNSYPNFPKQGTQLFAEEETVDMPEDGIYFEPIVPLPDKVDSLTGEEGEEVMFCERSKLFRFDINTRQWKERGVGNIKLLTNPAKGRSRIVMRREQVLKVCANHFINPEMDLKPGLGSDRSWVWHTPSDFTEGTYTTETFSVKFKTKTIAANFKEVFDSLKERTEVLGEKEAVKTETTQLTSTNKQVFTKPVSSSAPVQPAFMPTHGAKAEETQFTSIKQKDFAQPVPHTTATVGFKFTFGEKPSQEVKPKQENTQHSFSKEPNKNACKSSLAETSPILVSFLKEKKPESFKCFLKQSDLIKKQDDFVFGCGNEPLFTIGQDTLRHSDGDDDDNVDVTKLSPSKTSSPSKPLTVVSPVKQSESLPENIPSDIPFGRDLPVSFKFSFNASPAQPDKKSNVPKTPEELKVGNPVSPEEFHPETEDDGIHFEPIIPLPEKIKVTTGEESEQTVFCHRAKLYRYTKEYSQWKERGLGDIKILYDPKSKRYRVLMRRDHVLKICANHIITADMCLKPNAGSEKSWTWSTLADFSDETPKPEMLAVRFKTKEISQEFQQKFKEAQEAVVAQKKSPIKVSFHFC